MRVSCEKSRKIGFINDNVKKKLDSVQQGTKNRDKRLLESGWGSLSGITAFFKEKFPLFFLRFLKENKRNFTKERKDFFLTSHFNETHDFDGFGTPEIH